MFTIVYYNSKLWYYGTLIYYGKLWYYGKNYGTRDKTMILYWELWNFDLRRKKHGRLPKTKKLWFIMKKKNYGNTTKQLKVLNKCIAL